MYIVEANLSAKEINQHRIQGLRYNLYPYIIAYLNLSIAKILCSTVEPISHLKDARLFLLSIVCTLNMIECCTRSRHLPLVDFELVYHVQHERKMLIPERFVVRSSEGARSLHDVFYLPAVHRPLAEVLQLLIRNTQGVLSLDLLEESDPDLEAGIGLEVVVAQGDVNAGLESFVEGFHPVGGHEQDASEISRRAASETA